jgi:hypothetical protein
MKRGRWSGGPPLLSSTGLSEEDASSDWLSLSWLIFAVCLLSLASSLLGVAAFVQSSLACRACGRQAATGRANGHLPVLGACSAERIVPSRRQAHQ